MTVAFWICASISAVSALFGVVYSTISLRAARGDTRTAAMYAFARSVALILVAVASFFVASVPFEAAVAIAMVVVQVIDSAIGVVLKERARTIGPATVAILNLAALIWMLTS